MDPQNQLSQLNLGPQMAQQMGSPMTSMGSPLNSQLAGQNAGQSGPSPRNRGGRQPGAEGYDVQATSQLFHNLMEVLPVTPQEWDAVVERYNHWAKSNNKVLRDVTSLKRKFKALANVKQLPSDPLCPPLVKQAKHLRRLLQEKADVGSLEEDNGECTGGGGEWNLPQDVPLSPFDGNNAQLGPQNQLKRKVMWSPSLAFSQRSKMDGGMPDNGNGNGNGKSPQQGVPGPGGTRDPKIDTIHSILTNLTHRVDALQNQILQQNNRIEGLQNQLTFLFQYTIRTGSLTGLQSLTSGSGANGVVGGGNVNTNVVLPQTPADSKPPNT